MYIHPSFLFGIIYVATPGLAKHNTEVLKSQTPTPYYLYAYTNAVDCHAFTDVLDIQIQPMNRRNFQNFFP